MEGGGGKVGLDGGVGAVRQACEDFSRRSHHKLHVLHDIRSLSGRLDESDGAGGALLRGTRGPGGGHWRGGRVGRPARWRLGRVDREAV